LAPNRATLVGVAGGGGAGRGGGPGAGVAVGVGGRGQGAGGRRGGIGGGRGGGRGGRRRGGRRARDRRGRRGRRRGDAGGAVRLAVLAVVLVARRRGGADTARTEQAHDEEHRASEGDDPFLHCVLRMRVRCAGMSPST